LTLAATTEALAAAGLNLTAALARADYDAMVPEPWQARAIQPDCRSVLLIGNGGRAFWDAFEHAPERSQRQDPLDTYTRRLLATLVPDATALYSDRRDATYLPLVALAERAGIGVRGRLGLLLHEQFGPWISIRAVAYLDVAATTPPAPEFDPCTNCAAPCEAACNGNVVSQHGLDIEGCFRTRIVDRRCRTRCDARKACVLGPEHAFSSDAVAHHSRIRWSPRIAAQALRVLATPKR
jgi:hypothetical protein